MAAYWAEAVYHYKQGMQWWLDPKMQGFAEKQNQLRFENDAWEQDVKQWADSNSIEDTTERCAKWSVIYHSRSNDPK